MGTFSISDGLTSFRHEQPGRLALPQDTFPFIQRNGRSFLHCCHLFLLSASDVFYPPEREYNQLHKNPCKEIRFTGIFYIQVI